MLQLAICDRSSEYRRQLSELLEERLQTIASEVELFSSGEELLRYLNAGYGRSRKRRLAGRAAECALSRLPDHLCLG